MQKSNYVPKDWLRHALALILAFSLSFGILPAKVHLRKSADKDSTSLQTLPEGEEVTLLSTSGSWYKVRYGKYTGYIMKQYITTRCQSQVN